MKGIFVFVLLFAIFPNESYSQVDEFRKAYEDFKGQAQKEYSDFRDQANKEYAEFMRHAWENHKTLPAKPKPIEEDVPPVVIKEEEKRKIYHITELGQEVLDLEKKRIRRLFRNVEEYENGRN